MEITRTITKNGELQTNGFWFEDTMDGRVIHIELTPEEIANIGESYATPMYIGDVKELWVEQTASYLDRVYHYEGGQVDAEEIINDYIAHILDDLENYSLDDLRKFDPRRTDDLVESAFRDFYYSFDALDVETQLEVLTALNDSVGFWSIEEAIDFANENAWFTNSEVVAYKEV